MFRKRAASAALAVALLALLPPVASAVTTTVTFDDLSNPNRVLNGQYPSGVIDWGSNNAWWLSGPYSVDSTQSVSFNGAALTSATFTFITPQRLLQVDAINGGIGSSTVSLACAGLTTVNQSVGVNQWVTIATNWASNCSTVTVSSTNGWWTNFDNLVFDNGSGPVITNVQATSITANAATIQWTTNVGASSQVDYGTTSNYGSQSPLNSSLVTSHSVPLASLSAGTQYHYRARSADSSNNLSLSGDFTFTTSPPGCSPPITNPIPCENGLAGSPPSVWDIPTGDSGDPTIQGFATDISYPAGATVNFKISTPANAYTITIFRIGFYQGSGARQVATVGPSAPLPQSQPQCLTDNTTGLIDCGNWGVSASWTIPSNAVSGVYIAQLRRSDTGGVSHIHFVVRDDAGNSPIVFQTSDTTWTAYNSYGGNSLYVGGPGTSPSRAYKVSYNRPYINRGNPNNLGKSGFFWDSEYPMIRWLEANGYNVSYTASMDTDRNGAAALEKHKLFMSNGHDEYWSGNERANIETARGAGLNLGFFSGNTTFWKTRWENSIDSSHAANRTLVSYKETNANRVIDPADPPTWTGTWRDPRFSPPADGGRPENRLLGNIFMVNANRTDTVVVTSAFSHLRFWRNTTVANLGSGGSVSLSPGSLGAEWDSDLDNGSRPPGLFDLSSTTIFVNSLLLDYGSTYGSGNATHNLTMYRDPGGALVFATGFYRWAWGLDTNHDDGGSTLDTNMQQATVNVFADMGIQPATLQSGLRPATASTDTTPASSAITSPTNGSIVSPNTTITISGTANDSDGVVAGVEISVDGGTTWHPGSGLTSWTYQWTTGASGSATIRSRAVDDSGNLETPSAGVTVTIGTPPTATPTPSPTPTLTPTAGATPTPTPTTVAGTLLVGDSSIESMDDSNSPGMGQEFPFSAQNSGTATTAHVYLAALNGGTSMVVGIYNSSHALLAKCTITALSANAWNACTLGNSLSITSGTTYELALLQPAGQAGIIHFRDRSGVGSTSDTSPSSSLGDLPPTWSVGSSWLSGPASMYVN